MVEAFGRKSGKVLRLLVHVLMYASYLLAPFHLNPSPCRRGSLHEGPAHWVAQTHLPMPGGRIRKKSICPCSHCRMAAGELHQHPKASSGEALLALLAAEHP